MKLVLGFLGVAAVAMAGSWTGVVSEAGCGAKHAKASEADVQCIERCVKRGAAPVFVTSDDKVLKIANKDKVMSHLGHKVTVTGNVENDTLTIDSVEMAK